MKEIEFGSAMQYSIDEYSETWNETMKKWERMPIKWIVLSEEKDRMLLISKYCLFFEQYNDWFSGDSGKIKWGDCTLRHFLKNKYNLFSAAEYRRILDTDTENGTDKLFILTLEEAIRYMPNNEDRKAKPTENACIELRKKGAFIISHEDCCEWWLRDRSEEDLSSVMLIRKDGSYDKKGKYLNSKPVGVRPAMWIRQDAG